MCFKHPLSRYQCNHHTLKYTYKKIIMNDFVTITTIPPGACHATGPYGWNPWCVTTRSTWVCRYWNYWYALFHLKFPFLSTKCTDSWFRCHCTHHLFFTLFLHIQAFSKHICATAKSYCTKSFLHMNISLHMDAWAMQLSPCISPRVLPTVFMG